MRMVGGIFWGSRTCEQGDEWALPLLVLFSMGSQLIGDGAGVYLDQWSSIPVLEQESNYEEVARLGFVLIATSRYTFVNLRGGHNRVDESWLHRLNELLLFGSGRGARYI